MEEWVGIRVWIEAGSECSGVERVVEDEEVGFDDEDNCNDDESSWRFTKRRCCSCDAASA